MGWKGGKKRFVLFHCKEKWRSRPGDFLGFGSMKEKKRRARWRRRRRQLSRRHFLTDHKARVTRVYSSFCPNPDDLGRRHRGDSAEWRKTKTSEDFLSFTPKVCDKEREKEMREEVIEWLAAGLRGVIYQRTSKLFFKSRGLFHIKTIK